MHYNFVRIHQTLRVTPAMEAGVTDRLWDLTRHCADSGRMAGEPTSYARQWWDLRIRVALVLGGLLALAIVVLFKGFGINLNPEFLGIFIPLNMFEVCGAVMYLDAFKCPRCGQKYFQGPVIFRWWPDARNYYWLSRKCLNCSLPKWS